MKKRFVPLFAALLTALVFLNTSCSGREDATSADATDQQAVTENKDSGLSGSELSGSGLSESESRVSDLPPLPLTDLNGQRLMVNNLRGKTVLVLFQPECEDCQREAVQIQENLQAFKDYAIYFVSNAALPQQAMFAEHYKLNGYPNVHFAQTSIDDIINTLGPTPAPSVFIYSAQGRLVKAFKGETDIQQILSHL